MKLHEVRRASDAVPRSSKYTAAEILIRYKYWLCLGIYALGFAITWANSGTAGTQRVWLSLPEVFANSLRVNLHAAIVIVTGAAILFATLAALLRTWAHTRSSFPDLKNGANQRGSRSVRMLQAGMVLHTFAISLLMSRGAALFTIAAVLGLESAGEILSRGRREDSMPDVNEAEGVISSATAVPEGITWLNGAAKEIYMWGVAITFAAFGSSYNAALMMQGVLVSFGVSLVLRGLLRTR